MSFDVFLIRFRTLPEGIEQHRALSGVIDVLRNESPAWLAFNLIEAEKGPEVEVCSVLEDGQEIREGAFGFGGGAFFLHGLPPPLVRVIHTAHSRANWSSSPRWRGQAS